MRVRDLLQQLLRAPMDATLRLLVDEETDTEDPSKVRVLELGQVVGPSLDTGRQMSQVEGDWVLVPFPGMNEAPTYEEAFPIRSEGPVVKEPPKNHIRARIAVAVWFDQTEKQWRLYGEGAELSRKCDPKTWAENTIVENGVNNGEPLHWRWVEAWIPLPTEEEIDVEGEVSRG